ncbi:hypothetical protein ACA910_017269 [Epithemia clementina (nom. ined.)]
MSEFVDVDEGDSAPIILGEAPPDYGAPPDYTGGDYSAPDFAAPPSEPGVEDPQYLGEVNEAPTTEDADAPILMGMDGDAVPAEPAEPQGPTPMQKWNDEWQVVLKQRKDEENAVKAELVEKARVDMEKFQEEREKKRQAKMAKNREDEQAKLEAIEADLENDNSWQRVCKMIELSHDGAEKGDVTRMIDTLILLKNDTTRAEALSA